jgi:dihydroxyacetone kinase-like protein
MLDALVPAATALASALRTGASESEAGMAASEAARVGRDGTRDMVAQRGRASYLGERARGHLDPGAASSFILIDALAAALVDQPAAPTSASASR